MICSGTMSTIHDYFRRQVIGGTAKRVCLVFHKLGKSKVDNNRIAILIDEYILRLQEEEMAKDE